MVISMIEVVFTHNFAFRPTGIVREAYSNYLNMLYADENAGLCDEDISVLKVNELYSWSTLGSSWSGADSPSPVIRTGWKMRAWDRGEDGYTVVMI
ncbi:hypothetical protein [Bradyrhizobium murdochi]|uniref:hypothetical protein n=1 Tax=Bradyrhizobium murdochi TaxID=1038859 RepID=UPI000415FEFE|nr:hypothetical protein [Bradyrhizobium murdochi]